MTYFSLCDSKRAGNVSHVIAFPLVSGGLLLRRESAADGSVTVVKEKIPL